MFAHSPVTADEINLLKLSAGLVSELASAQHLQGSIFKLASRLEVPGKVGGAKAHLS